VRMEMKIGVLVSALLLLGSSAMADRVASRPTSSYGVASNITVAGPTTTSGGFTESVVCGETTEPSDLTTCDAPTPFTSGVFVLLIDTPTLAAGTLVTFTFDPAAFNASNHFGLTTGCDQDFTSIASCININNIDATCETSVFNGLSGSGSTVNFVVPTCASSGVTLFFDESGSSFATDISAKPPASTPEPKTGLLLALGLVPMLVLGRRLLNS
jgi:hypothetical protein